MCTSIVVKIVLVMVIISLSGLHSLVEMVISNRWSIREMCRVSLICGGLKCFAMSL